MNGDLTGIGGLLGRIVPTVSYALAIGTKIKQHPFKPLKPIQPSTRNIKTLKTNVTSLSYYQASQRLREYYEKNPPPPRPDFSTRKTDPDFARKYREWWYYFE